jgi:hypothetical protein
MSAERVERSGYNVVYKISGPFDPATANAYQDLNAEDYYEIGDALGAIIDFREMTHVTVRGLHTVQNRLNGVIFDAPVAFVGHTNSIFMTFLRGVEALTSRGRQRFAFFDTREEAKAWIDAWFEEHDKDRDALYGRISAAIARPAGQAPQTTYDDEEE